MQYNAMELTPKIIILALLALVGCKDRSPSNVFNGYPVKNKVQHSFSTPISQDTLLYLKSFKSNFVDARNVEVWLPKGYPQKDIAYKVLYMHDGQNVFNDASATYGTAWNIGHKMDSLITAGAIKPAIVVASWSHPEKRFNEYMPAQPGELTSSAFAKAKLKQNSCCNTLYSDDYLKFMVNELKPFIDSNFQVSTNAADTSIMGSSMGGLISLYATIKYPDIYGNAACLSTHWPVPLLGEPFIESLPTTIPRASLHKYYFDYGTLTLDAAYEPYQLKVDSIFNAKGYTDANYKSLKFNNHEHSEKYWSRRVAQPLVFLLSN